MQLTVKPGAGRKIIAPDGRVMPENIPFEIATDDPFWARRLRAGDIITVSAPAASQGVKAGSGTTQKTEKEA